MTLPEGIQASPPDVRPTAAMPEAAPSMLSTPRAQVARVLVAVPLAALLAAGPFVAWDLTTQPPRAEARSAWPRPSPWKEAGTGAVAAMKGIARAYLPRSKAAPPVASETPPPPSAPAATVPPTVASAALVGVYPMPVPTVNTPWMK